ncbi:two-component system, sensor histidine kinase [uncultured Gammaproteobacteria bacterium]
MAPAPIPDNEKERLAELRSFEILDSPPEEVFDRYTRLAAKILNVPIAAISLVDEVRQWFKSHHGLDASETPRDWAFCAHAILEAEPLVVPDATLDPRFCDNPLVTGAPDIRFYAGAPLKTRNHFNIGTLCIIDSKPHKATTKWELDVLRELADAVINELYLHKQTSVLQSLGKAQSQLAAIIESSDDAIISKTLDGVITSWNQGARKIFGYSAQEAIGRSMTLLLPPERAHEEPVILAKIMRGERIDHFETVRIRKDGKEIDVSVTISPIVDHTGTIVGVSKIARDISERRLVERGLTDRQERLSAILNTVVDGIITIDRNGIIETFNPAAAIIFGYSAHEVIGQNIKVLMPNPYQDEHDGYLRRFLKTGEARVIGIGREVVGRRKDGTTFPMELAVNEMGVQGQRMFTGIVRDISERKRIEAELQRASQAKNDFLAVMSHELRTPMTGILGMADLLLGSPMPADQRNFVAKLKQSAEILLVLLNDILDFSKIEAGQLTLERIDFSPRQVATEVIDLFQGKASERGNLLCLETGPLPAAVKGDPTRVRQVLLNLVGNAAKFTEAGSVDVNVTQIEPTENGVPRLSFKVTDTGVGMTELQLAGLFQPFSQADASTTRRFGGTGLGLVICRRLIEAMGGEISVRSTPGRGTTITFVIPAETGDPAALILAAEQAPALPEAVEGATEARGLHLLLAEDNDTNRMLIATALQRLGHQVVTVDNGQRAVEAVQGGNFDLVLMDMQMPVMDGPTATRAIRSLPSPQGTIPIVALTADLHAEARCRTAQIGFDDFLTKPVNWRQLSEVIRHHTAGRGPATMPAPIIVTEPVPVPDPMADLPDLDPEMLAITLEDLDPRDIRLILNSFIQRIEDPLVAAEQAVAAGDPTAIRRACHSLRGMASQFGARRAEVICQQMEDEADNLPAATPLLPALRDTVIKAMSGVSAILNRTEQEK